MNRDHGGVVPLRTDHQPGPTNRFDSGIRTFHAFYLPGHRTDPRPAAAGGLDCGAGSGDVVADPAAIAVWEPARRPCDGASLWPRVSGGPRSRPAAGVLAWRYRVPRRGQSYVRR